MATLNYNKIKKEHLTVTFPGDNGLTIMIGTPTKAVMSELIELKASFQAIKENAEDLEAIDVLYDTCAKVMSHNKGGVAISKEYLEEVFDFQDLLIFFNAYMDFIDKLSKANEKN